MMANRRAVTQALDVRNFFISPTVFFWDLDAARDGDRIKQKAQFLGLHDGRDAYLPIAFRTLDETAPDYREGPAHASLVYRSSEPGKLSNSPVEGSIAATLNPPPHPPAPC